MKTTYEIDEVEFQTAVSQWSVSNKKVPVTTAQLQAAITVWFETQTSIRLTGTEMFDITDTGVSVTLGAPVAQGVIGGNTPSPIPAPYPTPPLVTVIPLAPNSATGKATVFGRNYNGSNDTGDLNRDGSDSTGFFIDPSTGKNYVTHNDTCIGASLPREVLLSTLLGNNDWRTQPVAAVWGAHAAAVQEAVTSRQISMTIHDFVTSKTADSIPLVDAGPTATTYALLDRTLGLCNLMGSKDDSHVAVWLHGPDKVPLVLGGWLFDAEKVG
jgi:hypothetical protein